MRRLSVILLMLMISSAGYFRHGLLLATSVLMFRLDASSCLGAEAWLTTGNKSALLEPQAPVSFSPGVGVGGFSVTVDSDQTYQTIDGFGASLTDSSAWLIQNRLSPQQQESLMELLFSPTGGINLNYLRLPMGASDFTASGFYTYNDLPPGQTDAAQSRFSVDHDREYIIPRLQQAASINPQLKLMGTPWSAPAWMKTMHSLTSGSLDAQWFGSYAIYLKRFIEDYAAEGLTIDTMSLQNEPLFTPFTYPSMSMTADQQADLIKNHVGPLFATAGVGTKLLIYDHNWDNTQYAIDLLDDPEVRQYVEGTAFHGYAGDVTAQSTVHAAHPDKGIYFTEISGGEFAPNFSDNLIWGIRNIIIGNMRNWGRNALYWNLALDEDHGPHQNGCDDCRGVVTIDSVTGDVTLNEEFYTLAHASKFVQPGAARIHSRSYTSLQTVAFQNPDGSIALIALNPNSTTTSFRVVEDRGHFPYQLPPRSVATFLWHDLVGDFDGNELLECHDIDALVAEVAGGGQTPAFDLTGDGRVDYDDVEAWLVTAGSHNLGPGVRYLVGDANLDGGVDTSDFNVWNAHKFTTAPAWCQGDFTADGVVDTSDFNAWNAHKFQNGGSVALVPEPVQPRGLWVVIAVVLGVRRYLAWLRHSNSRTRSGV